MKKTRMLKEAYLKSKIFIIYVMIIICRPGLSRPLNTKLNSRPKERAFSPQPEIRSQKFEHLLQRPKNK